MTTIQIQMHLDEYLEDIYPFFEVIIQQAQQLSNMIHTQPENAQSLTNVINNVSIGTGNPVQITRDELLNINQEVPTCQIQ